MNIKLLFATLTLLSALTSPSFAANPTTSQAAFETGTESFDAGNYKAAVQSFKKAETQGMKSPSLYYNLASSYYMLGEYEKANEYYQKTRSYKGMKQLADYNLGLIALKQNDIETAADLFSSVEKTTSDNKLRTLSKSQLKDIRSKTITPWFTKKWSAYLNASMGYDDNVNFAPLGIADEISSKFSEVVASVDYLLSGNRRNGWLAEGYLYSIKYYDIDGEFDDLFDEYEFGAGIKKFLRLSKTWQTQYSLDVSKSNYAGEDYQTIIRAGAQARKSLSRNERLNFRYSYEDINSDNELFDYLEGWRQKLRAEYRLYRNQDNSRLYYELELNDRKDISIAAGNFSYSPTRHTIRGRYSRYLSKKWYLTGDIAYRYSDYPTTADLDRQDNRYRAAAYADYRFTRDLKLRLKAEYTDNSSTEDIFTYKRTMYTLGLNALF